MSDAGEGLVDAEAKLQERMEEMERNRRQKAAGPSVKDPDRARLVESLRLARAEMDRQLAATEHPIRRKQITLAIEELDRRLQQGV
jgi:hypothetical protein